jgi:SAM-dependent methyltransferase
MRRLTGEIVDRLGVLLEQRDELTPPRRMFADPDRVDGSHDVREFVWIGESTVRWLIDCGLQPHHRVLEIGCGIGRMAIPLTRHLKGGGSYDGLDITRDKVAYCRRTIGRRHPHFRFRLADVHNKYYNPSGTQKAATYRFPYDDATFDFVFLVSVFTHMLPDGMTRYLGEIARVLRSRGKTAITFYLTDVPAGDGFYNYSDVCHVIDHAEPEHGVVYNEHFVKTLFARHGVHIDAIFHGARQRDRAERQQDFVTAVKA